MARVKSRLGKRGIGLLPIAGRYNRSPKKLEDDYILTDTVLGCGANGQVLLGTSRLDGRDVAVKTFKLQKVSAEQKEQFVEEAAVFLAMDHPHVARLINVYESKQELHLIMECLTGGELFNRVLERKWFTERSAADAARQMLLALNYIHSHDIVHRDIKLENFLYEAEDNDHLKLIDFGFSKIWAPSTRMAACCGSLAYVAPEVLRQSYTSQCDMWSFGVTIFIVLFGYMPFTDSSADNQRRAISRGQYIYSEDVWSRVSTSAQEFVTQLLVVDPEARLTADQALRHQWIVDRKKLKDGDPALNQHIIDGLCSFGAASAFRKACMSMMAWGLTIAERAKVRDAFLELDTDHTGVISPKEFRNVLQGRFGCSDEQVEEMFQALSAGSSDEIKYSDFLAAMVCSSRVDVSEDLLRATFKRFDTDNSGFITVGNLREVLGETWSAEQIADLVREVGTRDDRICYRDWIDYLRGEGLPMTRRFTRSPSSMISMGSTRGSVPLTIGFVPERAGLAAGRRRRRLSSRLALLAALCLACLVAARLRRRGLDQLGRFLARKALRRRDALLNSS